MTTLQTQALTVTINQQIICDNLNLVFQPGEIWGILGPTGSGKTTLLHTLAGLHKSKQGDIWLQHQHLTTLAPKTIAQSIGLLFQDVITTFPQTVWDYCYAARYPHQHYLQTTSATDKQIVMLALQQVDLYSAANKSITALSGGEKRRLAIAAILAQAPRIYLLDEPTNHLDIHYQMRVLTHFYQLAITPPAATIIMALHDINLAQQFCTHVLLLFNHSHILQGRTVDVLTATNLSQLYRYNMHVIHNDRGVYWRPESGITTKTY